MKKYLKFYSTEIVFILVSILFILLTSFEILNPMNITAIFLQNSYVFILVVGMTFCMSVKDNIDISVGSFACFICTMGGVFMSVLKINTLLSVILLFILGILWGLLAGYIIAYFSIPAWITTLGGYLAFRGLGVALINNFSNTGSIVGIHDSFIRLFSGKAFATRIGTFSYGSLLFCILLAILFITYRYLSDKKEAVKTSTLSIISYIIALIISIVIGVSFALTGGVPISFIWMILLVGISVIWIDKTTNGRKLIMLAANLENARLAGINTNKAIILTYVFMAICATLTGCIVLARFHASSSYAGVNFEMDTIAACAIGGYSMHLGKQKIYKGILGAGLIGIINLGLSLIGFDMNYQLIIKGIIILLAVSFDRYLKKDKYEL